MAVIVGAACQPLQPVENTVDAGNGTVPHTEVRQTGDQHGRQGASGHGSRTSNQTATPSTAFSVTPARTLPLVALLVPLSGRQQALGEAVRDGFIAAHLEAPSGGRVQIMMIDEAAMSASQAWQQASDAGASVLVGPLLKESVEAIAPLAAEMTKGLFGNGAGDLTRDATTSAFGQMPILALNNLSDSDAGVGSIWQFGLAPEDEAREVAQRAVALGQRRAAVLVPASEWGQRLLDAFSNEFVARGGTVVEVRTYLPGAPDYSAPIRSLLRTTEPMSGIAASGANPGEKVNLGPGHRQDVDLIFLATNSSNGRQLVPQLKFFGGGDLPTYSTSAVWEDNAGDARDLNGVVFPDGPWIIAPDGRASLVKNGITLHWGRGALALSRLYALGYDAYRLLPTIQSQAYPGPFLTGEIPGSTGVLYADSTGRIHRRLVFAEIRDGRIMPLPAVGTFGGSEAGGF
ncbi:MAG: penicillin-binding protein activator [Gammaproteobacteria bacterium]